MRKLSLFALVILFGLGWLAAQSVPNPPWNHNPASKDGPDHWWELNGTAWETCKTGDKQSPIHLPANPNQPGSLKPIVFHYRVFDSTVWNTGHVIEVCALKQSDPKKQECDKGDPLGGSISIDKEEFVLKEFHFHAPSEHTLKVNGMDWEGALEAHFVNVAKDGSGKTVVVGVLMQGVTSGGNPDVARVIRNAPPTVRDAPRPIQLDATKLVAGAGNRFFAYRGSLTTPPCGQGPGGEGLYWNVFQQPARVNTDAVVYLRGLIANFPGYAGYDKNNRPPLNRSTPRVELRERALSER
jgi:carbonic anhydrase